VWLIVLELTVVRCLGFQFNVDYQVTMLVVIWALGWAMVVLAALVWLPTTAILVVGVVMVAGHNLLDGVRSAHPLWVMLHAQGIVVNRPGFVVFVAYPLVPWVGVTGSRLCAGPDLSNGKRAPARVPAACRPGPRRRVCVAAHGQQLRQPRALGHASVDGTHHPVVPQRHQATAVAAVPADDAGPGTA
jgi:uncharacterized membrane protein